MNFIELCRQVIGIESTPSHGTRELVDFLAKYAQGLGLEAIVQLETLNGLEQGNLIVRLGPKGSVKFGSKGPRDEILLQTHLDTVEPGNFAMWTKTQASPFNASIYQDRIYGLGAADVKLDFLCKLEALRVLRDKSLHKSVAVVGTFGAQSGMAGAIKLMRKKMVSASKVLIGEPTALQLVYAGPGMAVIEVVIPFSEEEIEYRKKHDLMESSSSQSRMFSGRAAHSSDPDRGENAIVKMLEYLAQLPDGIAIMDLDGGINYNSVPSSAVLEVDIVGGFRDPIVPKISAIMSALQRVDMKFKSFPDQGFLPSHPTMNIGMIRTFDDQVRLTGSCRLPPSVTDSVYEEWMSDLSVACEQASATFHVQDYKKAFKTSLDSGFLRQCQEVLKNSHLTSTPVTTSVSTEASVFSRLGMECLVFGPGVGAGNSHAPNECVSIEDLHKATDFYRQVVERFCL